MNSFLEQLGSDPILMISAAIGIVLILFIVLVVVVANLRIKTYKDRYINTRIDNMEKEKLISSLQKELQELKILNTQNKQELQHFADTKKRLEETKEKLSSTQKSLAQTQKSLAQTEAQLKHLNEIHDVLGEEHTSLKERFEVLNEENSKLRVNNARLLMKLESEERVNGRHHQSRGSERS